MRAATMQNQIASSPDLQLLHKPTWCAAATCNSTAAMQFAGRSLCLEHFLPACIAEIESRNEQLRNLPFDPAATEALKSFIATCAQQAETLAANAIARQAEQQFAEDSPSTRAPMKTAVLDFLLRLSQLTQRIRRGPRTASSISVW